MERLLVELWKSGHVGNRCCWRQLVLLALSVAASGTMYADEAVFRVENGTIIVSSPFDLEMGSTEYAKIAGKVLRVHRYASYDPDTKKTTTNETVYARAKLAKPYFGCRTISLNFGGKEKRLSNIDMNWERDKQRMARVLH